MCATLVRCIRWRDAVLTAVTRPLEECESPTWAQDTGKQRFFFPPPLCCRRRRALITISPRRWDARCTIWNVLQSIRVGQYADRHAWRRRGSKKLTRSFRVVNFLRWPTDIVYYVNRCCNASFLITKRELAGRRVSKGIDRSIPSWWTLFRKDIVVFLPFHMSSSTLPCF